jgi:TPR repeat protein
MSVFLDNQELSLLATAGDGQAQFCLALRYAHGEGLQQSWPKAEYW